MYSNRYMIASYLYICFGKISLFLDTTLVPTINPFVVSINATVGELISLQLQTILSTHVIIAASTKATIIKLYFR